MIHLIDVEKRFGKRTLFTKANLHVRPDDRVGLVGANGTGKTTVFRILTGEVEADEGEVNRRKGLRIGHLEQEVVVQRSGTLLADVVASVGEVESLKAEQARLEERLAVADEHELEALAARLGQAQDRFLSAGGYEVEGRAREILAGLGFSESDFGRDLRAFSGGWHMRVELAKLLLQDLDLLLLDEPTNHLDLETIEWFERFLASFGGAYILVAHDREFLNRTVRRIVDVSPDGIREYPGNYDTYRERVERDDELATKRYQEQLARIREIEDFVARNRARKDRATQVQSRLKQLEKIERLRPPRSSRQVHFHFPPAARSGATVLSLRGVDMAYGAHKVFSELELAVMREERIALVGLNGAGKSTLLKLIAGSLTPTAGERALGHNVSLQYFAQHQLDALDLRRTAQAEMESAATSETMSYVRSLLGAFLFSGDDVDKLVAVLSGGEKARVALGKMLLRSANLLVMDEPTNHLDIESREVLERALKRFGGTIVFTSHDRTFIENVATKIIEIDAGALHHYLGNWSYYLWKKARYEEDRPDVRPTDASPTDAAPSRRDEERERKRDEAKRRNERFRLLKPLKDEMATLEARVDELEARAAAIDEELSDPEVYRDAERVRSLNQEKSAGARELDEHMTRWEELGEGVEALED
jgi:ATP-binding cassette, subfamily F, member 3